MSKTLAQIFAINPTTVINDTDLFYLVQSPYTPGTDAGILGSDLKTALGKGTVTSVSAGTGITLTPNPITTTGSVSLTIPVTVIHGGTGLTSTTINQLLYSSAANTIAGLPTVNRSSLSTNSTGVPTWLALTDGQVIIGSTAGSPAAASLSAGTGISITPGSNTITISNTGGTLTSISAGTGITLTPNPIISTGSVTLTIPVLETSGGTGQITYTLGDTLYASAANTLSKLAGNITTAKQYLSQTGTGAVSAAPIWATISGGDITGAALTKTDDTNVTLTLGGTPTTALLRATSLTLGWTGQLSLTRGGTNASLTASNGGIVWSNATQLQILAGTATAQQMLQSGSTATPAWSTSTWPATTTINQLLYSSSANTVTGLATAANSVLITSAGSVPSLSTTLPSGLTIPGYFHNVVVQTFISPGAFTYTPTTGMVVCIIELQAGGGGAGGVASAALLTSSTGGGGGGGYLKFFCTAAQIGPSISGVVGAAGSGGSAGANNGTAGGNTTFVTTSTWTAGGGNFSNGQTATTASSNSTFGGIGGTNTTGTGTLIANIQGQEGGFGCGTFSATALIVCSGVGGSSQLGRGGAPTFSTSLATSAPGRNATGFGGGGTGAVGLNSNSNAAGGFGTSGCVIITEFIG